MQEEKEKKVPFSTQLTEKDLELVKNLAKAEGKSVSDFTGECIRAYAAEPKVVEEIEGEDGLYYFTLPKNHYEAVSAVEELLDVANVRGDWARKVHTICIARRHMPGTTDPLILKWRAERVAQGSLENKTKASGENNSRRG